MIQNWFITGDIHGNISRFKTYPFPSESGLIILGDAGFNYHMNELDDALKTGAESLAVKKDFTFYCVRGNHEGRPAEVRGIIHTYDPDVNGYIYYESKFPHIRYFYDYGQIYTLGEYKVTTIGGAYSVDKYYRLMQGWNWHSNEQLSPEEMKKCTKYLLQKNVDFVFSHTCPYSWRPVDLFLRGLDQSTVDSSMELWLDELKEKFDWGVWCFGHYHSDRIERPRAEMFFQDIVELSTVYNRWLGDNPTFEDEWWLERSPNFEEYKND